jgi:hypothetical protein
MTLSLKEPDFFLDNDWTLLLRFKEPSLSRSRTLLRLGDSSLGEDMGAGVDGIGVIDGRESCSSIRCCRTTLISRSSISSD